MARTFRYLLTPLAASVLSCSAALAQNVQGVTASEVRIGSIQDLSGPFANYSKEQVNGMRMRFDEANAAGGVGGRKIQLIVEDSGSDMKKAVLAAQKLIQRDQIFMSLGTMGTALTAQTMPLFLEAGVVHAFPNGGIPATYEPPSPLKFAYFPPYSYMGRLIIRYAVSTKAERKFCTFVQDDDIGLDMLRGVNAEMAARKQSLVEQTSYKRGATEFASQVARMKNAGCDTVLLASGPREAVGAIAESRKTGFNPEFIGAIGTYSDLIAKLGGDAMNGMKAVGLNDQPDADSPADGMRRWVAAYRTRFNDSPGQIASLGYAMADWTVKGLQAAGPALTAASFNAAMEKTTFAADDLGFPSVTFTPTKRLGPTAMRVYHLDGGKWRPVGNHISF